MSEDQWSSICEQCGSAYIRVKSWQRYCSKKCKRKANNKPTSKYVKEYTKTPVFKYNVHRQTAKRRGVPFELSFEEWWAYWEPHWEHRGRGKGCLVMSRYGDVGPYVVGNVFINTYEANSREAAKAQKQCRNSTSGQFIKEVNSDG